MLTRSDIIGGYRLFYGETLESEKTIQRRLKNLRNVSSMVRRLMRSEKFSEEEVTARLKSTPVTGDLIDLGYQLILQRPPREREIEDRKLKSLESQWHLIQALTKTDEFKFKTDLKKYSKSPEFNRIPKVIYLHIPKTAGKAVEKLAEKNYGEASSLSTTGGFPWEVWRSARFVGGHFNYTEFANKRGQRLFVSLVRDPVERAISRFNFYRDRPRSHHRRERMGFDHDDMKATLRKSTYRIEFMNNYQCYFLSGSHDFKSVQRSFENDTFIVGHYDQLDAWLERLGERLGWSDLELPKVNAAANPDYMREYLEDKKLVSMLKRGNQEDYKLLEFVQRHGVYESSPPDFDYSTFQSVLA